MLRCLLGIHLSWVCEAADDKVVIGQGVPLCSEGCQPSPRLVVVVDT